MSEQSPIYLKSNKHIPDSIEGFAKLSSANRYDTGDYESPLPEQIKALRMMLGMSQNDLAKLVGVAWNHKKGSSTVRKWETAIGKTEHRVIKYAQWRGLLIHAGIVDRF